MEGLTSPKFWLIVFGLMIVVRLPFVGTRARLVLYAASTAALFATTEYVAAYAALLAVVGYGYVGLAVGTGKRAIAIHAVVFSLVFAGSQHLAPLTDALPGALRFLPLIGLPYVYLRYLHLLIEVKNGRIPRPPGLRYVVYMLPFHQIISGPIERYPDFEKQLEADVDKLTPDLTIRALNRITNGMIKKLVLCDLLQQAVGFQFESSGLALWAEIDLFAVFIYLEFSGYMDMVIGAGMLAGWRPPENFNWPYLTRNIINFWKVWHITLSEWIRDYIFNPLNLNLQRGKLRGRPVWAGIACYTVAMVFCGLWHRADAQFALWGLLHGLGIIACKQYELLLKKVLSRKAFKAYRTSRIAAVPAGFVTFQFVAVSFVFAFHPITKALDIVGRLL